ncbi:MAG: DUF86 domain-containing protein [Acidobacteria bacterium]|nr:DUF86 domain-containing protein [Acidobacteriota bacterium]
MRPLEVRKFLFDIAEACEFIENFTAGKTFNDYSQDPLLRSAVERQFEIGGEALNQALRLDPTLALHISDSGRIIAFRNRLIHAYPSINHRLVWGVVEDNLPTLHREINALLSQDDQLP